MFTRKLPVGTMGGRAGSRRGQRRKLSHSADLRTASADPTNPTPCGALEINGLSELACSGPNSQASVRLPSPPSRGHLGKGEALGEVALHLRPLWRDNWRLLAGCIPCSWTAGPSWVGIGGTSLSTLDEDTHRAHLTLAPSAWPVRGMGPVRWAQLPLTS